MAGKHRVRSLRCRIGVHRRWAWGGNGMEACHIWMGECVRCGRKQETTNLI